MNTNYKHYYYESTAPDFIHNILNSFNIYTFDNMCCLFMNISLNSINNSFHPLYSKANNKIYNNFIKRLNCHSLCFTDKPTFLIIYLYDIHFDTLEKIFVEFYDFIHKIEIPYHDRLLQLDIKTGLFYSYKIKDPIMILDNAYSQYLNALKDQIFLSIMIK